MIKILYKLLNDKIILLTIIFAYRWVMDLLYANLTHPEVEYMGFIIDTNEQQKFISWVILGFFSCLLLPYMSSKRDFSTLFVIMVFFYRVVPVTSIMGFVSQPDSLLFSQLVYWGLLLILPLYINVQIAPSFNKTKTSKTNIERVINSILYITAFVVVFVSGYYAHFRLHFSLDNIYDLREEARSFDMPAPILYLWAAAKNILPMLFVFYILKKKYWFCLFIAFIILLDFSIDGLKAKIFYLLLCILLHYFYNEHLKTYLGVVFLGLALVCYIEYLFYETSLLHFIVVRRVLFEPGLLDTYYYDYVANHGPLYYVRGAVSIQRVIGDLYFDSPDMNSNNGLFSDAYMNLGFIGCIVYPLVLTIIIRSFDKMFKFANKELVFFSCMIMVVTLGSSELTTSLFTHGLLFLFIILYLISVSNYKQLNINKKR